MTRQRYDDKGTKFGEYIRTKHQKYIGSHTFSCQNLDYIWHNYRDSWLITIEEKRFGGTRNKGAQLAQKDTHGIVTQMLGKASGSQVNTLRGKKPVEYRGHYVIVFENETPIDGKMWINGKSCDEASLLHLFHTGHLLQTGCCSKIPTFRGEGEIGDQSFGTMGTPG